MPLFLFQYTNNAYYVDCAQQQCYDFLKKLDSGFEPGSTVPEAKSGNKTLCLRHFF
jgi:hypothetical protein